MNNCLDTTTAFNIDENETSGTCTNNRCNFVSNYINHKNNNIVVNGDNITINHTGTTSETEVTFAGTNYRIKNVKLFKSSLHTFENDYVDAELIIHHIGGNKDLLVCVPIVESNYSNESSRILKNLLKKASGESSQFQYNLKEFIPNNKMFYYEGPLPYGMLNGNYDIVVFQKNDTCTIDSKTLEKLNTMLEKSPQCKESNKKTNNIDLYLNTDYTPENIINSNIHVSITQMDNENNEEQITRQYIKEAIKEIENRSDLKTDMSTGKMYNLDALRNSIQKNLDESINSEIEGFTIEGMLFDSPNKNDIYTFLKYMLLVSIIGGAIYGVTKIVSKKK